MAKINLNRAHATESAIYKAYEDSRETRFQMRLGAAQIGEKCERKLWYSLHWALPPKEFEGRMLRLFETGQREESRILENLIATGYETHGEGASGAQFESHAPHFVGKADGVILGIPEAPKTWHLLEIKTHNKNSFEKLEAKGVKSSKPLHYAQMQSQMGYIEPKLERALYISVCKNDDRIYIERVQFDEKYFKALDDKRKRIIEANSPPAKIAENYSEQNFDCRYCDFKNLCHGHQEPLKSCRSCIYSTPCAESNEWICEKHDENLSAQKQQFGCEDHLFIPDMVPHEVVQIWNGSRQSPGVEYKTLEGETLWNLPGAGLKDTPC